MLYKTLNMQPKQTWHQRPQPPCATLEKKKHNTCHHGAFAGSVFYDRRRRFTKPYVLQQQRRALLLAQFLGNWSHYLPFDETNSKRSENQWKMKSPFWGPAYVQNLLLVSGSVCIESYRLTRCLHVIDTFDTLHPRWCRVSSTNVN